MKFKAHLFKSYSLVTLKHISDDHFPLCSKRNIVVIFILIVLLNLLRYSPALPRDLPLFKTLKKTIITDHRRFYSKSTCSNLAIGLGIAAIFANSSIDREIGHWYQASIRCHNTNSISKIVKPLGNGRITIPVYLISALLGEVWKNNPVAKFAGSWGGYSARAIIVGAPLVLFLQPGLGASRPYETDSKWRPFRDNNAVSGHSFMGAIPFLVLAKMSDNKFVKTMCYMGSTLTGLSRINDDKHYFNQIALGWWLAYLSTSSMFSTQSDKIAFTSTSYQRSFKVDIFFYFN